VDMRKQLDYTNQRHHIHFCKTAKVKWINHMPGLNLLVHQPIQFI
jgi:hypothetical protein